MDKEYVDRATQPSRLAGIGDCAKAPPSPAEILRARASELRDQAFRYEALARQLERLPLQPEAADTLVRALGGGLYRA